MTAVPGSHTFVDGVALSSEMNTYVRDPLAFLLARPIAALRQTAAQAIPNGTPTAITMDTEDVDSAAAHSTSSNTSRYTAVYAGWHRLGGGVSYAVNATGVRGAYWYVNGSVISGSEVILPSAAAVFLSVPARSMIVYLNIGDYAELFSYQTSGGALNTAASGQAQSSMAVEWVSN